MNSLLKFLLSILILGALVYGIYWLWQRQPNLKVEESKPQTKEQVQIKEQKIKPQDFSILSSTSVKIEGKANPEDYVAVYSNSFAQIVKADNDGKFAIGVNLEKGLNLMRLLSISKDLKETSETTLTYWVENADIGNTVFAGSIKGIFEGNVTVSTSAGEKTINTSKSTSIEAPENTELTSTKSALANLRVGDYLIALGDLKEENLSAKKIQVIRENKPQVTKKIFIAKLLIAPKNNLFSAKAIKDQKIEEFTLVKNSKEAEKVAKDKDAIIIYHDEKDQKVVDLVYLLVN